MEIECLDECRVCQAKDKHIEFLEKLVELYTESLKHSDKVFIPKYVNEIGEVVDMKPEEAIELIDTELNEVEDAER